MNCRRLAGCRQSWQAFRRMGDELGEFRDSQDADDDGPGVVAVDGAGADEGETRDERTAALQDENRELRETFEGEAEELAALRRQVAELGEWEQEPGGADAVDGGRGQPGD